MRTTVKQPQPSALSSTRTSPYHYLSCGRLPPNSISKPKPIPRLRSPRTNQSIARLPIAISIANAIAIGQKKLSLPGNARQAHNPAFPSSDR